jgi:hypothetical protein
MDQNYLDYLANISTEDMGESLRTLVKEYYDSFKPYLDELYHIEANYIYLNVVCGVPQVLIADTVGVSQYGVSKRVTGGFKKLEYLLKIPEKSRPIVSGDFEAILPPYMSETLFSYYFLRTFALTARVLDLDPNVVNVTVSEAINYLDKYSKCDTLTQLIQVYLQSHGCTFKSLKDLEHNHPAEYLQICFLRDNPDEAEMIPIKASRYKEYLSGLIKNSSYGDYTFKHLDQQRNK